MLEVKNSQIVLHPAPISSGALVRKDGNSTPASKDGQFGISIRGTFNVAIQPFHQVKMGEVGVCSANNNFDANKKKDQFTSRKNAKLTTFFSK